MGRQRGGLEPAEPYASYAPDSPSTGPEGISFHAVIFMPRVRKVESTIVDLSLARLVQHSPFQFYALPSYTRVVSQIDGAVRAYAHAHDDFEGAGARLGTRLQKH